MPSPIQFYALIIISPLIQFTAYVFGSKEQYYKDCASFNCGHISDISYPFRLLNGADYCGHPEFEVECVNYESFDRLILKIGSVKYLVNDITWEKKRLSITRMDLLWSHLCPKQYINATLDLSLFYYAPGSENATLYYDCKETQIQDPYKFSCMIEGLAKLGYLFFHTKEQTQEQLQLVEGCNQSINICLLERPNLPTSRTFPLEDIIIETLHKGFEVGWKADMEMKQCQSCHSSGGNCGHDNTTNEFNCFCPKGAYEKTCPQPGSQRALRQKALIAAGIVIGGSIMTIILFYFIKRPFLKRYSGYQDIEDFIKQHGSLAPKRYKYSEVKRITNSFRDKLGQGGYGAVYKGILRNGCSVAVKMLNIAKGNGEEFINEVASISRTSHVNIVTLLGFCYEGKRRALIYEFMANGSLDKFINDGTAGSPHAQLGWEKLYQIAIRIARGLEYLHRGCNTRILHFDIKPHNILLDEEFNPKISDFGLAKLCLNKESIVSMMTARGTIGYIAPEVFNRNFGGVSPKSDVYSFGMMVLEMIGATKKIKDEVDGSSQLYFPDWIYTRFELGQELETYYNLTSGESEILRKMVLIGLRCIQINPSERPSMSKVIEMLEGSVQALPIPPKPFFTTPTRAPEGSYSTSILLIQE